MNVFRTFLNKAPLVPLLRYSSSEDGLDPTDTDHAVDLVPLGKLNPMKPASLSDQTLKRFNNGQPYTRTSLRGSIASQARYGIPISGWAWK